MPNITKTILRSSIISAGAFVACFGWVQTAFSAEPQTCNEPVIKNIEPLRTQGCVAAAPALKPLTKREARKLNANAKSAQDHLKLVRYYRDEADSLDAKGAAYEEAAAAAAHGPVVKNLMSPAAAGEYAALAKSFRRDAKADRDLATLHEQLALGLTGKPRSTSF